MKQKKFESSIQKRYNISMKKATMYANYYASYYIHDLVDLLWDDLSDEEREVYEAGMREIWLKPREFSNLFHPKTFETYFTSNEYEAQREFVARQNYDHVSKEKLNDFLTYLKNFRFYEPSSEVVEPPDLQKTFLYPTPIYELEPDKFGSSSCGISHIL